MGLWLINHIKKNNNERKTKNTLRLNPYDALAEKPISFRFGM